MLVLTVGEAIGSGIDRFIAWLTQVMQEPDSIAAVAAVVTALVAALALRATTSATQQSARPYMSAHLETNDKLTLVFIIIKNTGRTSARKLRFEFDKKMPSGGEASANNTPQNLREYVDHLEGSSWPPGHVATNLYMVVNHPDKEPVPGDFVNLKITYRGYRRILGMWGKKYTETFVLNMGALQKEMKVLPSTPKQQRKSVPFTQTPDWQWMKGEGAAEEYE